MLHALLNPTTPSGVFFTNDTAEIVSSYIFPSDPNSSHIYDGPSTSGEEGASYAEGGVVNGTRVLGYGGSDLGVRSLWLHTEEATREAWG